MKETKKNKDSANSPAGLSRRDFMGRTAAAAAGLMIIPRHVLGGGVRPAPSDTLNIGCVGVGGKGTSDIWGVSTENIVALCDVDDEQMSAFINHRRHEAEQKEKYGQANKYRDFRIMLDKEKDLDAITVSTPDHNHAVIAMAAMKRGKHVFVQKPLTHTVVEARKLAEAAKKYDLVTQMGNQGHAGEEARLINEWIWDGAIGDVREVHCWTNRPIWPQGIDAPKEIPSVPSTLDWNVWLGPAPFRPYHPAYHPFSWRGWWDFGTGAVGDMGAHIIDHPYWALKLGLPVSVQASCSPYTKDSFPMAEMITYEFAARGSMPPVTMKWYDGGLMPPRPKGMEDSRLMGDSGGGVLFIGDKGILMCSVYGKNPRLVPETFMKEYKRPEKTIPRSSGIHTEWVEAIKAGKKSTTDFSYASKLTETMLLGNVAIKTQEAKVKLLYDGAAMKFTNLEEANTLLHKDYRTGWSL